MRVPKEYETQDQVGQLRLICYPGVRDGIADWSFKWEEGTDRTIREDIW